MSEAELGVVGGMLNDNTQIDQCVSLNLSDFTNQNLAKAYQAVQDIHKSNGVADVITVSTHIGGNERHWLQICGEAAKNAIPSHTPQYAKAVKRQALRRLTSDIVSDAHIKLQNSSLSDYSEVVADLTSSLINLSKGEKNTSYGMEELLGGALDEIDRRYEIAQSGVETIGIPTGLEKLDNETGGLHESDLIVIGGRPAMGKTAMLLNMVLAANVPAGIISGEQPAQQMTMRMMSIQNHIDSAKMRNGKFEEDDWPKITSSVSVLKDKQIYINDKANPYIEDIESQAREWFYRDGIKVLYVDFVQKFKRRVSMGSRVDDISDIIRRLKGLARDLNIPVVALAQVNRKVEERKDKRPRMSDFKESGVIEEEADVGILLYRDEVYNSESKDKGVMEIIIDKNRHGRTCFTRAFWHPQYLKVSGDRYVS